MMIIKHGNKWYYFVCPSCGCEWSAGMKEAHQLKSVAICASREPLQKYIDSLPKSRQNLYVIETNKPPESEE